MCDQLKSEFWLSFTGMLSIIWSKACSVEQAGAQTPAMLGDAGR